ncbi:hypothetical protein [Pedobacter jamesrossensis]|uniref:Uncharacterized protein n=1 Tax=Pedobacter jamesrossensis TaxID=1908238 RepID=A0ABV8NP68_9SPHI
MREKEISNDLQKFIDKFEPAKFKALTEGIEIRGVKDIHRNLARAREVIDRLKLELTIHHDAEMLSYGGFEVNNIHRNLL